MPTETFPRFGIDLRGVRVWSFTYKIFVVEGTDTFHVHLKQWEWERVRKGRNTEPWLCDCHVDSVTVTKHGVRHRPVCKLVCASFARHATTRDLLASLSCVLLLIFYPCQVFESFRVFTDKAKKKRLSRNL